MDLADVLLALFALGLGRGDADPLVGFKASLFLCVILAISLVGVTVSISPGGML